MTFVLRTALLLAIFTGGFFAQAQQSAQDIQPRIAAISSKLEAISKSVREEDLDDGALLQLRGQLEPLSTANQAILNELQPQLDAARQQLEQAGPKPEAGASAEAVKARAELQKAVDDVDAQVRRVRVVGVRITQVAAEITNARRDLLLGEIFKGTSSALNPMLWYNGVRSLPRVGQTGAFFAGEWGARFQTRLHGARLVRFLVAVTLLIAGYILLRRLAFRYAARKPRATTPPLLERALAAIGVAIVIAALPVAAAYGFVEALKFFDLVPAYSEPLIAAFLEAVRMVSISVGLARGLLSPGHPEWSLLNLPDAVARRYNALAVNFVAVLAGLRVVEAINGIVAAPLDVSVAFRALFTLAAAGLLVQALFSAGRIAQRVEAELGPRIDQSRDWFALWRIAIWGGIISVFGANVLGYVNFANFLATQIMWVTFILATGFLIYTVANETIAYFMQPEASFARATANTLGIRATSLRQVSILLSGVVTLLIYLVAILLILAPWGVESDSVFDTLQAAFFGFSFGAINFSLSAIAIAIILFAMGLIATRAFQRWLDGNYLPSTELDSGLRNSITTSAGYVGIIAAIALPFAYLGFNFDKLAIVAGALSVGIGFGLQSVVSNFVSGLILLWERAVKVGDWVIVGSDQGIVKRINVRSTEIETFERQTVIVPNSNLISGVVKNWVRVDRKGRFNLEIRVEYNSDPADVRDILLDCARKHANVLASPAPSVLFTEFANTSLNFDLRCFVDDVDNMGKARSDLRFEVFRRFREAGIIIAQPFGASSATFG